MRRPGPAAVNPVAEAPEDERFRVAWRPGHEAFLGFGCDPDAVLSGKAGELGFRKQGYQRIPGDQPTGFVRV